MKKKSHHKKRRTVWSQEREERLNSIKTLIASTRKLPVVGRADYLQLAEHSLWMLEEIRRLVAYNIQESQKHDLPDPKTRTELAQTKSLLGSLRELLSKTLKEGVNETDIKKAVNQTKRFRDEHYDLLRKQVLTMRVALLPFANEGSLMEKEDSSKEGVRACKLPKSAFVKAKDALENQK